MSNVKIKEVLRRHTDKLMAVPGVVGIAEGKCHGKPCIRVFVVDSHSEALKHLPENIEGYLLNIEESGEFRALGT